MRHGVPETVDEDPDLTSPAACLWRAESSTLPAGTVAACNWLLLGPCFGSCLNCCAAWRGSGAWEVSSSSSQRSAPRAPLPP
ncbi:hypothetical protein VTH82DRAFT_8001 [Thermothelomyces myriococcoides]